MGKKFLISVQFVLLHMEVFIWKSCWGYQGGFGGVGMAGGGGGGVGGMFGGGGGGTGAVGMGGLLPSMMLGPPAPPGGPPTLTEASLRQAVRHTLPPGYANVQGEIMSTTNKVIQRVTPSGTNYYKYDDQNGQPVFKRRELDNGKRFVLFPDLNFPPGDGHYIILRKLRGMYVPSTSGQQPLYEAFQLSLTDSFHGYVSDMPARYTFPVVDHQGGIPAMPTLRAAG